MSNRINTAQLGRWIRSWVQHDGSIHGFHNHSVWGGNPYRWSDFTAGHSTWASPFIAGLASAVSRCSNEPAEELLRKLVRYQATSFQENGNYKHVGFQIGELLPHGLIHNACPNVSLASAVVIAGDILGDDLCAMVKEAFERNKPWHGRVSEGFCSNQDYARIWGKLLYRQAFGDDRFLQEAFEDLDILQEKAHVLGVPKKGCTGVYRNLADTNGLEPAEYYGLMISPLILAYEISGKGAYLDQAGEICRHVVESSWRDEQGCLRFHRTWMRINGEWIRSTTPMLISGMGFTLEGIRSYLRHQPDPSLLEAVDEFDKTYAHYQHPAGFFAAASGWQSEIDVVPSSAWHTHDWRYLVEQATVDQVFWDQFWSDYDKVAVVLGDQCFWVEDGQHWAIDDYAWMDVFDIKGRKDRVKFGRDLVWVGGPNALPDEYQFSPPAFIKMDDFIKRQDDGKKVDVLNLSSISYVD